jgi:hypothetical protein
VMEDTADVTPKRVLTAARTALEPTPHGVRLRQRSAALIGLVLGVLGFLAAVGLGQFVALALLGLFALLAAAGGVGVVALARRQHLASKVARAVRVLGRPVTGRRHVLASGALVTRQRAEELWQKRLAGQPAGARVQPTAGGRSSQRPWCGPASERRR